MAEFEVMVSLTETQQYRRLVEFLEDCHEHAVLGTDMHLLDLVEDCKDDLCELAGKMAPDPWREGE